MKILIILFCLFAFTANAATTQKQLEFCPSGMIHILLNDYPDQEFYIQLSKLNYKYILPNELNTAMILYWEDIKALHKAENELRNNKIISSIECLQDKDFIRKQ